MPRGAGSAPGIIPSRALSSGSRRSTNATSGRPRAAIASDTVHVWTSLLASATICLNPFFIGSLLAMRKCLRREDRPLDAEKSLGRLAEEVLEARSAAAERDISAIAVLPFADMSPGRDQDYLCEVLAEELINALTQIDGLRVAARTASFHFRGGADVREVGARLG